MKQNKDSLHFNYEDLSTILNRESSYIEHLKNDFGKNTVFRNNVEQIASVCTKREISNEGIDILLRNVQAGILYIFFSPQYLKAIESIFPLILSDSFEKEQLKEAVKPVYKSVLLNNNTHSLIFETAVIKLFLEYYDNNKSNISGDVKYFDNALNFLRDSLIEIRNELHSYNIFNRQFHKEIFDKSYIPPKTVLSKPEEMLKKKIHSYYFPYRLFFDLMKLFNTLGSLERELEIISYYEDRTIWSIDDIDSPPHLYYIPFLRDEVKNIIIKTINKNSKQTEEYLKKEENDLDSQINRIKSDLKDDLAAFENNFKKEIDDSLKYPLDVSLVSKINSYIIDFNRKSMASILMSNKLLERYNVLKKKMIKNEQLRNIDYDSLVSAYKNNSNLNTSDVFLSLMAFNDYSRYYDEIFDKHRKYIVKTAKQSFDTLKKAFKEGDKSSEDDLLLMKNILKSKTFSTEFNYDFVKDNFFSIMKSIENDLMTNLLINSVKIYNKEFCRSKIKQKKEIFYITDFLIPHDSYVIFSEESSAVRHFSINNDKFNEIGNVIRKHYSKVVSTLVYDIRGSSLMSSKLNNAQKQTYIMRKFQSGINSTIKKHRGFALKETGDGGIALFFNRTKDIYRNLYKETVSSRNLHIRHSIATGTDINIRESQESSSVAIDCSIEMIKNAEKFIKENYMNYREWFFDVTEKELKHEGVEYALLPPEFKSLFRIGVGIASGTVNKDIDLNINAYGDIDIYGTDINQAQFFSEGRNPQESLLIIDHATLFNLMLNKDFVLDDIDIKPDELLVDFILSSKHVVHNQLKYVGGYLIDFFGLYYIDESDKNKRMAYDYIPDKLSITDNGTLLIKKRPVKLLYKIKSI